MEQTKAIAPQRSLKLMLEEPATKNRLREILGQRAPQFAAALIQVASKSWQLQACRPESVIGAAMTAAALDLSIDPNLGEAHLIPYGDKCTFQIGYLGLVQLAIRSGQYKRLGWKVIYDGELISWDQLSGELLYDADKRKSDTIVGYAAKFVLCNGFERATFWTEQEVEEHAKRYSQAVRANKADSPWFTHREKMCLKTVLKELIRQWGPKSIQMQRAYVEDNTVRTTIDSEPKQIEDLAIDESQAPITNPPPIDIPKVETRPTQTADSAELADMGLAPKPTKEPETQDTGTKGFSLQSEQKAPPLKTSADYCAEWMEREGITFEEFMEWCQESGNLKDTSSIPDLNAIDGRTLRRLMSSSSVIAAKIKGKRL